MDVVSLSLGVVGLAIQLVDMSEKIRNAIDSYRSASKEVRSLSDKLASVESACRSIRTGLENRRFSAIQLLDMDRALGGCMERVSELGGVLSKVTKERKGFPFNSVGAQFLLREGKIQRCNKGLDESLSTLHFLLTVNVM